MCAIFSNIHSFRLQTFNYFSQMLHIFQLEVMNRAFNEEKWNTFLRFRVCKTRIFWKLNKMSERRKEISFCSTQHQHHHHHYHVFSCRRCRSLFKLLVNMFYVVILYFHFHVASSFHGKWGLKIYFHLVHA